MKRVLSLVAALALSITTISSVKADELTKAQNDYKDVQNSISDNKEQLNQINNQKDSTQKEIEEIDKKIDAAAESLNSINNDIADVNDEINEQEKTIQETSNAIEAGNELLKKRIRAIYINGDESYLEIILGSSSFSDFISRIDTVSELMGYDKSIISDMEQKSDELRNAKASLEKKKGSMVVLKSTADMQYNTLQTASDEKKDYMSQLEQDKEKYENAIKQQEQESNAITAMIKKIQQKKAEEARKAAEAKKNAQGKGGSTSSSAAVPTSVNSSIGKLYCVTGRAYPITSPFGTREHPILEVVKAHTGLDIGVPSGTPIYSLADGVVIYSGTMSGYGNVVMVDHGDLTTLYAHNSSLAVKVGQTVKGGQLISYSGSTGLSTGPHLHFEVRNSSGTPIDPINYYVR